MRAGQSVLRPVRYIHATSQPWSQRCAPPTPLPRPQLSVGAPCPRSSCAGLSPSLQCNFRDCKCRNCRNCRNLAPRHGTRTPQPHSHRRTVRRTSLWLPLHTQQRAARARAAHALLHCSMQQCSPTVCYIGRLFWMTEAQPLHTSQTELRSTDRTYCNGRQGIQTARAAAPQAIILSYSGASQ